MSLCYADMQGKAVPLNLIPGVERKPPALLRFTSNPSTLRMSMSGTGLPDTERNVGTARAMWAKRMRSVRCGQTHAQCARLGLIAILLLKEQDSRDAKPELPRSGIPHSFINVPSMDNMEARGPWQISFVRGPQKIVRSVARSASLDLLERAPNPIIYHVFASFREAQDLPQTYSTARESGRTSSLAPFPRCTTADECEIRHDARPDNACEADDRDTEECGEKRVAYVCELPGRYGVMGVLQADERQLHTYRGSLVTAARVDESIQEDGNVFGYREECTQLVRDVTMGCQDKDGHACAGHHERPTGLRSTGIVAGWRRCWSLLGKEDASEILSSVGSVRQKERFG
ncbi:hypothetical protein C8Q74DRAFT_1222825 [Fomes fomentarius]|nr:hypothetical protein C8Q74DRAFT_1222825 [Fomes fomentarius]